MCKDCIPAGSRSRPPQSTQSGTPEGRMPSCSHQQEEEGHSPRGHVSSKVCVYTLAEPAVPALHCIAWAAVPPVVLPCATFLRAQMHAPAALAGPSRRKRGGCARCCQLYPVVPLNTSFTCVWASAPRAVRALKKHKHEGMNPTLPMYQFRHGSRVWDGAKREVTEGANRWRLYICLAAYGIWGDWR